MEGTMATFTGTYNETQINDREIGVGARFGGSQGRRGGSFTANEFFGKEYGSHMPLDTNIHWDWANPLNILPAIVLVVTLIAVLGMILA
jgi:hypothetical protein